MTAYDKFFDLSTRAFKRHGSIFDLPVTPSPYLYLKKAYDETYADGRVLDFGCGLPKTLQSVLRIGSDRYNTCDSDPSGEFTYSAVGDIPADITYHIIAANQVFEHLEFAEAIETTKSLAQHIVQGGILQIGVPNPQHPTRQLCNPTHKTPWTYMNLCALIELAGLDPFYCARCNKVPGPAWYERPLINMICRIFRMDWCDTVYAVGKKV